MRFVKFDPFDASLTRNPFIFNEMVIWTVRNNQYLALDYPRGPQRGFDAPIVPRIEGRPQLSNMFGSSKTKDAQRNH